MNTLFNIENKQNKEEYSLQFDIIAKKLLNEYVLKSPKEKYRIREIEFYYFSENHTDFYCHKNERQKTNSRLYFHRFKNPDKYLRLKQKGIDITIGNNSNVFGGILLRTLQNTITKEVITGIGKITNKIIEEIGSAETISEIYKNDKRIFDQSSIIQLLKIENNRYKIFKKQRIGLNHKESDQNGFFLSAKYNYFTYPEIEVLK